MRRFQEALQPAEEACQALVRQSLRRQQEACSLDQELEPFPLFWQILKIRVLGKTSLVRG